MLTNPSKFPPHVFSKVKGKGNNKKDVAPLRRLTIYIFCFCKRNSNSF